MPLMGGGIYKLPWMKSSSFLMPRFNDKVAHLRQQSVCPNSGGICIDILMQGLCFSPAIGLCLAEVS